MSDPLDVARYIFMNEEGELRSGWRVLAFCFLFILAEMLLTGLIRVTAAVFPGVGFIAREGSELDGVSVRGIAVLYVDAIRDLGAAVISSGFCARRLERRSLASVGFKLHRGWMKDFSLGSVIGGSSLAIAVGIAAAAGAVTFTAPTEHGAMLARGLAITFSFFLISAATEELIFRGFAFQALAHDLGGAAAIGITSLLFGIAHLGNDNASAFSTINTILAGVWLGLAYLITRSLWLAVALHYSWNFAMVFVFGLPVSGLATFNELSWLKGHPGGPAWVSGGSYGPEAGIGATVAVILSILVVWKSGLFRASQEMLDATRHGKPRPAYTTIAAASDNSEDGEKSLPTGESKAEGPPAG
jgi:membrane protease YdiL (CAAX protease family)